MAAPQTAKSPPTAEQEESGSHSPSTSIAPRVFWPSAIIIVAFVLYATIFKSSAQDVISTVQEEIISGLGWYHTALVSLFVIFALWVGIGRFGDIKLGKDDEKPEFGMGSWLAMLFAAGMGIGLLGRRRAAEPLRLPEAGRR